MTSCRSSILQQEVSSFTVRFFRLLSTFALFFLSSLLYSLQGGFCLLSVFYGPVQKPQGIAAKHLGVINGYDEDLWKIYHLVFVLSGLFL